MYALGLILDFRESCLWSLVKILDLIQDHNFKTGVRQGLGFLPKT